MYLYLIEIVIDLLQKTIQKYYANLTGPFKFILYVCFKIIHTKTELVKHNMSSYFLLLTGIFVRYNIMLLLVFH